MNHLRIFFGTVNELKISLAALLLGGFLGSVYDLFRALRKTVKHNAVAVALEDIAFCLFFGFFFYCFSLSLCAGELRGFVLTAMLVGFVIYIYTLGIIICDFISLTFSVNLKMLKSCTNGVSRVINFLKNHKKSSAKS